MLSQIKYQILGVKLCLKIFLMASAFGLPEICEQIFHIMALLTYFSGPLGISILFKY